MRTRSSRIVDVLYKLLALSILLNILFIIGCASQGYTKPPSPVTYSVGGTISGLTGMGLVLQNNGGDNLNVAAGTTTFTFSTPVASGSAYAVTVLTQPSNSSQNCVVSSGGSGTVTSSNITNVQITCASLYTIGGTIAGLTGTGLVLQDNGGNNLSVAAGATTFTFSTPVASGGTYAVTVLTQPATQVCTVGGGIGTVQSSNITNILLSCVTPPAGGAGVLTPSGGTVSTPLATVTAPPSATVTQQNVTITAVAPPPGLPTALTSVGVAVDVSVDGPTMINAPFLVTLPYDPTGVPDENEMAVVHYNTTNKRYEPVRILGHDTNAHSFQIESRTFSPFLIVYFAAALLDASHTVTGFTPPNNGWNIPNFGNYFSPGGNCLGMSAYATWYFDDGNAPSLSGEFSSNGSPSIAQLVVTRAHLAQSQYWAQVSNTYLSTLGPAATGLLMKMYLDVFDQPLILLLGVNGTAQHASVLYGYSATSFQFYDVNFIGSSVSVSFNGTSFGTYSTYNTFTYDALPSLGRTEDFAALTAEALGGFTSSSSIMVTSPTPGQQVPGYTVDLTGTLSSSLNSAAVVLPYLNQTGLGVLQPSNEAFSQSMIPIQAGDNQLILEAGANISQQSNWYQNAATLIFDFQGATFPLVGKWSGTGSFSEKGSPSTVSVNATVTRNQNSVTATIAFIDDTGLIEFNTETGQVNGQTLSIGPITTSGGDSVTITGTYSSDALNFSGSGTDATNGTTTANGTLTISADGLTITGNVTTSDGDTASWTMTRQ